MQRHYKHTTTTAAGLGAARLDAALVKVNISGGKAGHHATVEAGRQADKQCNAQPVIRNSGHETLDISVARQRCEVSSATGWPDGDASRWVRCAVAARYAPAKQPPKVPPVLGCRRLAKIRKAREVPVDVGGADGRYGRVAPSVRGKTTEGGRKVRPRRPRKTAGRRVKLADGIDQRHRQQPTSRQPLEPIVERPDRFTRGLKPVEVLSPVATVFAPLDVVAGQRAPRHSALAVAVGEPGSPFATHAGHSTAKNRDGNRPHSARKLPDGSHGLC